MATKRANNGRKASKPRRDLHAEITGKIVAQLEKGCAPWLKPWETGARFSGLPRNARSKRNYSGINVLILWTEAVDKGYASSEWLTFKQAKEFGGTVKRGEKGVQVVFMKKLSYTDTNAETGEIETRTPMLLRSYTVFNVEQCEGLNIKAAAPIEANGDAESLDAAFMDAVAATGADIRHGGGRAYYTPTLDFIQMPKVEAFRDNGHYMATLAHELAHWTGHKSRLDRLSMAGEQGKQGYAFEELVAELSASFSCAEFGIEGDLRHAGYINSWIKLLKDDPKALFRAASRASKATAFLFPSNAVDVKQAA